MAGPTLLLSAALALGSALGFVLVGAMVSRKAPAPDTMASMAFPAFWHFAGLVYASQGARTLLAYLDLDSWHLIVAIEQLSTPFYCLAAASICFYVLYLLTGRKQLVVPVLAYYLGILVLLRYHVARAEPIGYVVNDWQVNYVYAVGLQSGGYSIALALATAPIFAAIAAYATLLWRLEDPLVRWRIGWVGAGLALWVGVEAFAFATGLAAQPEGELLRRGAGLATAAVVTMGYARARAPTTSQANPTE